MQHGSWACPGVICRGPVQFRAIDQVGAVPTESRSMSALLSSYLPIVIFIGVALVVGVALIVAPFLVAYRNPDPEKLSAYECGFNSFDDARMKFDIRFYLVSILFIIFDLEVAFLFPWAVSFGKIGMLGFWSMMVFPWRADHRLHLRMEKGSAGMGLNDAPTRSSPPSPRASSIRTPASRSARTTASSATSTTNFPTRAFSSPRRRR